MDDGLITGIIHTPDETYHIEVTAEKKNKSCIKYCRNKSYLINEIVVQPSWRHLPHLDDKTMITYRGSDIRFSWDHPDDASKPRVCGYVKEGKGKHDLYFTQVL